MIRADQRSVKISSPRPQGEKRPHSALVDLPSPPAWDWPIALLIAALLLLVHGLALRQYGFFRDELYFLACAQRLDWGYVDHPPLSVWLLRGVVEVFGSSLVAVRLPVVLIGFTTVIVASRMTYELHGNRFAQATAAAFVLAAPVYRVVNHLYSMNGLDVLLWSVAVLLWIRVLGMGRISAGIGTWATLGVVIGLALLNKMSAIWLVMALLAGMLLTAHRREFGRPGPWVTAAIAFLLFAPHLIWQGQNGWITAEFVHNANFHKLEKMPAWQFLAIQAVVINPLLAIFWAYGAVLSLGARPIFRRWFPEARREWMPLGIAFFSVLALLLINGRARENYLSPAYPFIVSIVAIGISQWRVRCRQGVLGLALLSGVGLSPIVLPILSIQTMDDYLRKVPIPVPASQTGEPSHLQGFSDMFGWPEMAWHARRAVSMLSPEERRHAVVLTHNYGQAAAIRKFAPELTVIGRHNQWWLWGPGDWEGQVAILVGDFRPTELAAFASLTDLGPVGAEWAMPEEQRARVRIARQLDRPVSDYWRVLRRID